MNNNDFPRYYESPKGLLLTIRNENEDGTAFDGEKTWDLKDVPSANRSHLGGFGSHRLSVSEAADLRRSLTIMAQRSKQNASKPQLMAA